MRGPREFYRDLKLGMKLLILFVLFLLIPSVVILTLNYQISIRSLSDFVSDTALRHFDQTYGNLLARLESAEEELDKLTSNPAFRAIISKDVGSYSIYEQIADMHTLDTLLGDYKDGVSVKDAVVYIHDGLVYSDHNAFASFDSVSGEAWYQSILASPLSTRFFPLPKYPDTAILARKILHPMDYSKIVCVVRFSLSGLPGLLVNADISEEGFTFLVDETGSVFASSSAAQRGSHAARDLAAMRALPESDKLTSYRLGAEDILYLTREIPMTGWTMISVLPEKTLDAIIRSQVIVFFIIIAIMMIFVFISMLFVSRVLLSRMQIVTKQMIRDASGGVFQLLPAKYEGADEIGVLTRTYNDMITTIRRLIMEQDEAHQQLRMAENAALQEQVKPHFLYNTLDMISWLCRTGQKEDVLTAIEALAGFYKRTLAHGREIVTLQDEIEHVRTYMEIQRLRFGEINLHFSLNASANSALIPKLTLQPLVENALYHGVLEQGGDAMNIWISAESHPDRTEVWVEDSGVGMKPEQMKSILTTPSGNKGYGVWNIHRRIRLLFGEDYGLAYFPREGGGVRVLLVLPPTG